VRSPPHHTLHWPHEPGHDLLVGPTDRVRLDIASTPAGRPTGGGELVMITLVTRTGHAVRTALHWADDWTLLAFNADPTLHR
jgi:hypothetical protein